MKTSQYIFFSFLGLIFISILILYVDSVNTDIDRRNNAYVETIPEEDLESFSIIVANKNANITIKNDPANKILAKLFKTDSVFSLPEYKIVNDTLFISKSGYSAKTIIKCNAVKTIIGRENSNIYINNYKRDSLLIFLNKSKIFGWVKNKSMNFVDIKAYNESDVTLNLKHSKINDSRLKVDNSKVMLNNYNQSSLNNLTAILTNKASTYIFKTRKLDIECDSSSNYHTINISRILK